MKRLYRAVVSVDVCFVADDLSSALELRRAADKALNEEVRYNGVSPICQPKPFSIARVSKEDERAQWWADWSGGIAYGDNPDELTVAQLLARTAK